MSKIAIVSDKTTLLNIIESKLILLRNDDIILKCDISNLSQNVINSDIILLHTPELSQRTIELISSIKKDTNEIILILENYNPKDLLKAYDNGVCDFCSVNVTNFELLLKLVNAKKALKKTNIISNLKQILHNKGVLKSNLNFFTNIADIVNENNYRNLLGSTILSISLVENEFTSFNIVDFESNLALRDSDYIINYDRLKYLFVLSGTSLDDVQVVFDKLKKVNEKLEIKGVAFEYDNELAFELQNKIQRLETELDFIQDDLLVWRFKGQENVEADWTNYNLIDETKNYKIFQNIFSKKIETVIETVFYRIKQKYEKSFKNTKIKYSIDKECCEFLIVNFDKTNSFRIIFNNSAMLTVEMKFKGLDSPENERYSVSFSNFTIRYLTDLMEEFIKKGEEQCL